MNLDRFTPSVLVLGDFSRSTRRIERKPSFLRAEDPTNRVLCLLESAHGGHPPILQPTRELLTALDQNPGVFAGYVQAAIELNRAYFFQDHPDAHRYPVHALGQHRERAERIVLEARLLASWLYSEPRHFDMALRGIEHGAHALFARLEEERLEPRRMARAS
jgi:hypothetical protein